MSRLNGKRCLITGGTTGIGLETAKQFLVEGARVIITGNNPDTIQKARIELGTDVLAIKADSANVDEQRALAEQVKAHYGQLDVAFLNAGVADWRLIDAWDEEGFDRSFAINVKGPYFLMQALMPIFAKPASVILNTSINAHMGSARSTVYAATKAAFLSFAKTMSGELVARGIRVNAASPGPVETPLYEKMGRTPEQLAQAAEWIRKSVPADRFGTPVEVAKAVIYLASDEAAWTLGSEIIVDGGRSLNG
jgi:NAD(P)-dependent dehydrogenase (short-subunit alcohol dehydrogenase family)